MKTAATHTSRQTYAAIQEGISKSQLDIARCIQSLSKKGNMYGGGTIAMVASRLGMEKSSVAGRMNELKKLEAFHVDGERVKLEFLKVDLCPNGGRKAEFWKIVPAPLAPPTTHAPIQTALFGQ
jgi:hypothetical protein